MAKNNKSSMHSYMMKRASVGTTPKEGSAPSGNPVYRIEPRTASYQDSMIAYNKFKGKAAGAENLKPKGGPKKYVGQSKIKK